MLLKKVLYYLICLPKIFFDIISKEKHEKFFIFSDSLSVLLSLNNKKLEHPLIIKLLCRLHSTSNKESPC